MNNNFKEFFIYGLISLFCFFITDIIILRILFSVLFMICVGICLFEYIENGKD